MYTQYDSAKSKFLLQFSSSTELQPIKPILEICTLGRLIYSFE